MHGGQRNWRCRSIRFNISMNDNRAVERLVIATGVSSVVTQLLLLREFLSQFQGNEFTLSLIFFSWLLLGGIGTWLARLVRRFHCVSLLGLVVFSLLLALISPFEILAIRYLRDILFIPGVAVGFYPTLACIFFITLPCGLLVGFVLPYSLYVLRSREPMYPGARLYMLDNIGDVCGGALFSFILIRFVSPLQASFLASSVLLLSAFYAVPSEKRYKSVCLLPTIIVLVVLLCTLALEKHSLQPFEGNLVYYRESRYGRVTVHGEKEQFTLFIDGVPLYSSQNRQQAEEIIHYPLSQLDSPRSVLLIGAQSGVMQELEKYKLAKTDYLELDPQVTLVQFRYKLLTRIPGLNVIHQDGRLFLSQTDNKYDAIILNLPEPNTFQINRFYTATFFFLVSRHLRPGGIFSFTVNGYDNYLARPQQEKISSLYKTVSQYFKELLVLPGGTVCFLGSDSQLDPDIPALLAEKDIPTQYISNLFYGNVTLMRQDYLKEKLLPDIRINSDTSPFLLSVMFRQWFSRFSSSPTPFYVISGLLLIVYLARSRLEECVLFSTGFVTMGSESLVILVYQIFFGYVYEQIGLLVTVFLLGLLPGARIGEYLRFKNRNIMWLIRLDVLLVVSLTLFLFVLVYKPLVLQPAVLLGFGFLLSTLCGCQFPLALSLGGNDNSAAVRTFSADLIGAAYGTLVTTLILVPFFGIIWAVAALLSLKLCNVLLLVCSGMQFPKKLVKG